MQSSPLLLFYIVAMGMAKKQNIYEQFVEGAMDGIKTVVKIMPTLIGLMVGVGVLRASGFLTASSQLLKGFTDELHFPSELVPLFLIKMFSSSAATGLALDIFKSYGPESKLGLMTSLLLSSTETIFYTMSIYYMTAKIKKTRWTLPGALTATLAGTIASVMIAGRM